MKETRRQHSHMLCDHPANKADNSELINSRFPGATFLTGRCLRQGHNMEVATPLNKSEKPEIVISRFRHSFAVSSLRRDMLRNRK